MPTKEDLLSYSIRIRTRGDTYRYMIDYLEKNCEDEEMIKEIVQTVDQMEKEGRFEVPKPPQRGATPLSTIGGIALIIVGIGLIFFLWGKGWISTVPFIIIGVGGLALSGQLDKM